MILLLNAVDLLKNIEEIGMIIMLLKVEQRYLNQISKKLAQNLRFDPNNHSQLLIQVRDSYIQKEIEKPKQLKRNHCFILGTQILPKLQSLQKFQEIRNNRAPKKQAQSLLSLQKNCIFLLVSVIKYGQFQYVTQLQYCVFISNQSTYHYDIFILSNKMLKNLVLLLTLAQLTLNAITDFWSNEPVDQNTLQCLKRKGYLEEAFVFSEFNPNNQNWETFVDLQEIEKAGTTPNLILFTSKITGRLPPQLEAHRIYRQFEDSPIFKFWINLSTFEGDFRPTCSYLKTLAHYLKLYTKKEIGIQSEKLFWQDLFGSSDACRELAKYDLFLTFNNFKPFGGWKSFTYYETYQEINACGYSGMQVFKN